MKKILFIALFLLVGQLAYSQNVISLFAKANDFFYYLETGKYDTAHMYFDPSEQAKVSPETLKQIWESIKGKLGPVKSIDAIQSKTQGEFFAVTVEGIFENDTQNFIVKFNKAEKMLGLYLMPKVVSYKAPSYADTTKYAEKSVYLESTGKQLAAVITMPKNVKNFPIVVLVHGSGPSDMDETVGANKPFKDLAVGLAAQGIATLRYVKRTLIHANDFTGAFTVKEEVTDDAVAAVALAKKTAGVDPKNIYLLGHSLGGMLAPQIATLAPDLNGIILAAAPAKSLTDVIVEQNKYFYGLLKDTTATGQESFNKLIQDIEKSKFSQLGAMKPDSLILGLPASYWVSLNTYDQVATAKKINKRMFIFQGGNDFQVSDAHLGLWDAALNKKKNVTLKLYPTLNHLLSEQTEKGNTAQYQVPANVSEAVINDLAKWIKGQPVSK